MSPQNTPLPKRFIALDIHKHYFVAVGVDRQMEQIFGPQRAKIINLQEWSKQHLTLDDAVVIEMTTNTWEVYDQLVCYAGSITVVHPPHVTAVTKARVKTDRKAALTLAQLHAAGLLDGIWIPPKPVREIRSLIARRSKIVGLATQAKNRLHAVLHRYSFSLPDGPLFSPEQRHWWLSLPLSELEHICLKTDLNTLDFARQQIEMLDVALKEQAAQDERVLFLVQLPGCRWLSAITILAALGEISRFPTAKKLVGYSGLGASVHISGKASRTGKITKQGRRDLRTAMIRIAHAAARTHPHWQAELRRLEPRLGYQKAIVAIARKLLIVVWQVLSYHQVDRYAVDEKIARKLLQHSYDLGQQHRPGSAAKHVRQMLNHLGIGQELTYIRWSSSQKVPMPPE